MELYKIIDLYLKSQRENGVVNLNYFDLTKKQNEKVRQINSKISEIVGCYVSQFRAYVECLVI